MNRMRIGDAAAALGVAPDTVRRWVEAGRLRATRSRGGQRLLDPRAVARLAARRRAEAPPPAIAEQSARNRFPGVVVRVVKDRVAAQVEIQAGPHRIVSLLTREAVEDLGLRPGVAVVAAVKATSVVVETTRAARPAR